MTSKDLWSVVLALLPAFFVYQFGRRSKGNDSFLEGLSKSYDNVYFPMHIALKAIKESLGERDQLISDFFKMYNSPNSALKLLASTFVLERYFDLEKKHKSWIEHQDESSKSEFWKSFDSFYIMIEDEFWEGHDIIYKDYLKNKRLISKNPFIKLLMEISILIYNIMTFAVYAALAVTYFTIWNRFRPLSIFPNWWEIKYAIFLLLSVLVMYGLMLMISSWYIATRNKRKSKLIKKLDARTEKYLANFTYYVKKKIKRAV